MSDSPHEKLLAWLSREAVDFTLIEHEPVYTSAQAARVRDTDLHSGAKALVLKSDDGFLMAVVPADLELDGPALRKHLGSRRLRFASKDELLDITGLTPGAVPPFGSLFKLPTICDPGLGGCAFINFNAASHTHSVQMTFADYSRTERPQLVRIARP